MPTDLINFLPLYLTCFLLTAHIGGFLTPQTPPGADGKEDNYSI